MLVRLVAGVALAALLLGPMCAYAQGREVTLEHGGSVGLFAAAGAEYSSLVLNDCVFCLRGKTLDGPNALLDVGATLSFTQTSSELLLRGRLAFLSPARGESLLLGFRKYWGRDEFKTFAGLELMGTFRPVQTGGARVGFGAIWDFSPIMGLWAEAGATFGIGQGRRFGAEITLGFQGRSYLLE